MAEWLVWVEEVYGVEVVKHVAALPWMELREVIVRAQGELFPQGIAAGALVWGTRFWGREGVIWITSWTALRGSQLVRRDEVLLQQEEPALLYKRVKPSSVRSCLKNYCRVQICMLKFFFYEMRKCFDISLVVFVPSITHVILNFSTLTQTKTVWI